MREMKNSGISWLGKIPYDWKVGKVKHFYHFITGFTPDSKNESFYDESGVPWVTISDMGGKFVTGTKNGISSNYISIKNPTIIPSNSLLYSFKLSVGQVARTIFDVYTNEAIASFLPSDNISLDYLFYSSQVCIIENANENIYGAKLLNQDLINNATIIFPPLNEQQKIASFLDRKCSEIDEMIGLQEQIIEELKAYKQSVITEAVTKGLNPDVPMKDSGIEWIDLMPVSWKIAKIKNVISLLTDYDANGSFADIASNVKVNIGVPYAWMVRATDLANQRYGLVEGNNYCDISTFNYLKKSVVHSGDVLIAKRGEIGKVYLVPKVDCPMTLAPNTYILKLRQKVIDNRYFHYFLTSEMGRMQLVLNNKSTAIGAIYKDDVKSISILLSSIEEQQAIADYLDDKCADIDSLIQTKQSKIDSLKEYKKSIIYEYVTGKKEVTE